jgi:hypothetical protein
MAARLFVDSWDPSYGASLQASAAGGPAGAGSAKVDTDVELPAAAWRPLTAPPSVRSPDVVLLVDGVRRIDASLWTREDDGSSYPAIAASYAAGVVRCDLRRGAADLVGARVERAVFTASPGVDDVECGQVRYPARLVQGGTDPARLVTAVQAPLTALEVAVSAEARAASPVDGDDLLVVDGPLRNRRDLVRTVGYVKRQEGDYLDGALVSLVTALRPGERSPVFATGGWGGFSWYLRLPVASGAPWAGIVRLECSPELPPREAIGLADLSLVTLPRFASTPYKDPRAPQNLIPIAGLERKLRSLLGDARLLHRALTLATARPAPARVG